MKDKRNRRVANRRQGISTLEVVVSASLLIATISLSLPLTIKTGRLWQEIRQLRMAGDELASQMDQLLMVDVASLDEKLKELTLSKELDGVLPNARFSHRMINAETSSGIELSLDWDRGYPAQPLTLVGWRSQETNGGGKVEQTAAKPASVLVIASKEEPGSQFAKPVGAQP